MRAARCGLVALALSLSPLAASGGVAVEGTDRARIVPPSGIILENYRDAGYALTLNGDEAEVRVETWPLESSQRFRLPSGTATDAVTRLARALVAGADRRYDAVSRLLGWVGRNVRYDLDRSLAQDSTTVLERRSGYCTGIARLSVALLAAAGIPAREVPGWVVGNEGGTGIAGYHRWVEIFYDDRGWVMSDPLATHHYVPANYLRLAGETVVGQAGGVLLEREERISPVDVYGAAGDRVRARRNDSRQLSAALQLTVSGADRGTARLTGNGSAYAQPLVDGRAAFVGLEPGRYRLKVEIGNLAVEKDVRFRGRVRAALHVEAPARREEGVTR